MYGLLPGSRLIAVYKAGGGLWTLMYASQTLLSVADQAIIYLIFFFFFKALFQMRNINKHIWHR